MHIKSNGCPYSCDVCNMPFSKKTDLKIYQHGHRLYVCDKLGVTCLSCFYTNFQTFLACVTFEKY